MPHAKAQHRRYNKCTRYRQKETSRVHVNESVHQNRLIRPVLRLDEPLLGYLSNWNAILYLVVVLPNVLDSECLSRYQKYNQEKI